jgi:hypothetical protein
MLPPLQKTATLRPGHLRPDQAGQGRVRAQLRRAQMRLDPLTRGDHIREHRKIETGSRHRDMVLAGPPSASVGVTEGEPGTRDRARQLAREWLRAGKDDLFEELAAASACPAVDVASAALIEGQPCLTENLVVEAAGVVDHDDDGRAWAEMTSRVIEHGDHIRDVRGNGRLALPFLCSADLLAAAVAELE